MVQTLYTVILLQCFQAMISAMRPAGIIYSLLPSFPLPPFPSLPLPPSPFSPQTSNQDSLGSPAGAKTGLSSQASSKSPVNTRSPATTTTRVSFHNLFHFLFHHFPHSSSYSPSSSFILLPLHAFHCFLSTSSPSGYTDQHSSWDTCR